MPVLEVKGAASTASFDAVGNGITSSGAFTKKDTLPVLFLISLV